MVMRASFEVNLTLFPVIKGPGKVPPASTVLWLLVNTTPPEKLWRTNERLNPSGESCTFEISRLAVGPMAAEACREAAVMSKRKDKREFIEKNEPVRNESLGDRREGGEANNTQDEALYRCDRRLTADERDLFASTLDEYCIQPRAQNPSMPALQEVGNGFPIHKTQNFLKGKCRSMIGSSRSTPSYGKGV